LDKVDGGNLWPLAFWSYTVATAPLFCMAEKDIRAGSGEGSAITVFFAQIAYLVMAGAAILYAWPPIDLAALFMAVMLFSVLGQMVLAIAFGSEQSRYAH
jgi:uncharacterized protein (DUF1810 family)